MWLLGRVRWHFMTTPLLTFSFLFSGTPLSPDFFLKIYPFIHLSICPYVRLSICPSIHLSLICLSVSRLCARQQGLQRQMSYVPWSWGNQRPVTEEPGGVWQGPQERNPRGAADHRQWVPPGDVLSAASLSLCSWNVAAVQSCSLDISCHSVQLPQALASRCVNSIPVCKLMTSSP